MIANCGTQNISQRRGHIPQNDDVLQKESMICYILHFSRKSVLQVIASCFWLGCVEVRSASGDMNELEKGSWSCGQSFVLLAKHSTA